MKNPPKDKKRSVRDKYRRRLRWLASAVDQFEIAAQDRIEYGGNIRDRVELDAILEALKPLKELLPEERHDFDEKANKSLSEALGIP